MYKWVIEKEFKGHAYTYLSEDGKSFYSDKTEADYIAEGYLVISEDEFFAKVREYEDGLCGDWKEISEERYEEMLDILPPVAWHNGGFFMSERFTGNISAFLQKWHGKYYESLQRMTTPRKDIIASLCAYIEREVA